MTGWPEWTVCARADLDDPGARGFETGSGDWPFRGFVLLRDGEIHAYANICPHRRHPLDYPPDNFLAEGGQLIRCASHGAIFEPESGLCLAGPCGGQSLLKLECREEQGMIKVRAPDSLQDPGLDVSTT